MKGTCKDCPCRHNEPNHERHECRIDPPQVFRDIYGNPEPWYPEIEDLDAWCSRGREIMQREGLLAQLNTKGPGE